MSTLAIWCRVVQFRDVSPHNFDGLAMSGLAFSAALCDRLPRSPRKSILSLSIAHIVFAATRTIKYDGVGHKTLLVFLSASASAAAPAESHLD